MDGEKKTYPYGWEEPLFICIAAILLFKLLTFGLDAFEEKTGISLEGGIFSFLTGGVADIPLELDTPLGTKIINKNSTDVHSEPGGEVIATMPRGAKGEVIGGPVLLDGDVWWEVEYEDGTTGWVKSADILVDADRDRIAVKENTPHGTKVLTTEDIEIYSSPDENGVVTGTVPKGTKGTIIAGPVEKDGERWWQVRFEDGSVGWVPESALQIDRERNLRGLNDTTPLGTPVRNLENVEVYSAPRGGGVIGTQPKGAKGTVEQGPVTIGTTRWWYVDYEEGVDGWVREDSLERQFPATDAAKGVGSFIRALSLWFSAILGVVVLYLFFKLRDEVTREYHLFKPLSTLPNEHDAKNEKWERVLQNIESDNENDWRLAILEADILLDEMVATMMLEGDTLAERMNNIEKADFQTIDKAWEAHRMRNKIAHYSGEDFVISQREAKRIIALYKDVFEEFHYI